MRGGSTRAALYVFGHWAPGFFGKSVWQRPCSPFALSCRFGWPGLAALAAPEARLDFVSPDPVGAAVAAYPNALSLCRLRSKGRRQASVRAPQTGLL